MEKIFILIYALLMLPPLWLVVKIIRTLVHDIFLQRPSLEEEFVLVLKKDGLEFRISCNPKQEDSVRNFINILHQRLTTIYLPKTENMKNDPRRVV